MIARCLPVLCLVAATYARAQTLRSDSGFAFVAGGEVRRILVDGVGRTYVVAATAAQDRLIVSVLSREGRVLWKLGTDAAGDRTLRGFVTAGLTGDSLWLLDSRSTLWFTDSTRRLRRTASIDSVLIQGRRRMPVSVDRVLPDGGILATVPVTDRDPRNPLAVGTALVHVASTGDVIHRLADMPLEYVNGLLGPDDGWRPSAMRTLDSFASSQGGAFIVAAVPDTVPSDSGSVTIRVMRPDGSVVFASSVGVALLRLTPGVIDSTLTARGVRPASAAVYRSMAPPVYQPLKSIAVADDGRILLSLRSTGKARGLVRLSAAGEPDGRFSLPAGDDVLRFDGDLIWARRKRPDGDEVVRYRLPPP